jgi:hypothetical protein
VIDIEREELCSSLVGETTYTGVVAAAATCPPNQPSPSSGPIEERRVSTPTRPSHRTTGGNPSLLSWLYAIRRYKYFISMPSSNGALRVIC